MLVRNLKIHDFDDFVRKMRGLVFHATTLENYESILSSGGLLANLDGSRSSVFGNSNGFFRLRSCVSFFDYRNLGDKKVYQHLYKCIPTNIAQKYTTMAVLVLSKDAYPNLQSWTAWEKEEAYTLKVVPRIEIGYPEFVPMSSINEVLIVSFIS
ncbi:Uncharacterised protein [Plesiomonas shigelloides]|uniref:hypothetical protein n=1 Tax=Plesiomonas shigelloides TaxID=703 RepID=UPI00057AF090|nr:hypothetical protein [Plesiomonas shigelloides]SBT60913.1 Uncharacterised protein [Plesiomonas shigelloides]